MITMEMLEKLYEDFRESPGGEGWCIVDGIEYQSDMGYAIEGMEIFLSALKHRLEEVDNGSKT